MLKNCISNLKSLSFLRTSTYFGHPSLLKKKDKTVRDRLSYECNVNFNDISRTQLALPGEMDGVGVSSASFVTLCAFLDSVFGAIDFLRAIFLDTFEVVSFTNALEKWLVLTNRKVPLMEKRKIGPNLSTPKPPKVRVLEWMTNVPKFFYAHQGKFGSQWLNVAPCKNLGLKLDDQQLRISIGLRIGGNLCFAQGCHFTVEFL